jgi:hypothetical protein
LRRTARVKFTFGTVVCSVGYPSRGTVLCLWRLLFIEKFGIFLLDTIRGPAAALSSIQILRHLLDSADASNHIYKLGVSLIELIR